MQYTGDMATEYAKYRGVNPLILRCLIEGSGITLQSRVLEVGSGTGNYCTAIVSAVGCTCIGIDPSEGMLAVAETRNDRMEFLHGSAEALPYADASFDFVYSADVIHHVQGKDEFFCEASRVLKPGGMFCTVTDSEWTIRQRGLLSAYFPETVENELARYPSTKSLHEAMTLAGFANITETVTELPSLLTDCTPFRNKAFSCLHQISEDDFRRGLQRLEDDLAKMPEGIPWMNRSVMIWGRV